MKIIIVGAGEIGRHLATELSKQAHEIVVIETNERIAQELEETLDLRTIIGTGTSVNILAEANVAKCELFLALTSNDSVNLISGSMAKGLGVSKVVIRVHPGLQREEWMFDYRGHFHLDHMFSSERLSAIELSKFIRNPNSLIVEELARGKIELQQVRLHEKSNAVGKSLKQLGAPERTRLGTITRRGEHFVPNADSILEAGDLITIFGEPRRLRTLAARLQRTIGGLSGIRVVIFGGGEYGFALAQMLESWDCKVRIFERNERLCEELTGKLANTTVICADATVLAELEEEQVGEADFFVATSTSDEDNVMSCLQAHSLGVEKCLTLIHRADYARAISESGKHLGILAAVSPRVATQREIERFLISDRFHIVKQLGAGEILETRVPPKARIIGTAIRDIPWPDGCVIVGRLRGLQAEVPGPEDLIAGDDYLYAMVSPKAKRPFLKLLR